MVLVAHIPVCVVFSFTHQCVWLLVSRISVCVVLVLSIPVCVVLVSRIPVCVVLVSHIPVCVWN